MIREGVWGSVRTEMMNDIVFGNPNSIQKVTEHFTRAAVPIKGGCRSGVLLAWDGYREFASVVFGTTKWAEMGEMGGWAGACTVARAALASVHGEGTVPDALSIFCDHTDPNAGDYVLSVVLRSDSLDIGARRHESTSWRWQHRVEGNDALHRIRQAAFPAETNNPFSTTEQNGPIS